MNKLGKMHLKGHLFWLVWLGSLLFSVAAAERQLPRPCVPIPRSRQRSDRRSSGLCGGHVSSREGGRGRFRLNRGSDPLRRADSTLPGEEAGPPSQPDRSLATTTGHLDLLRTGVSLLADLFVRGRSLAVRGPQRAKGPSPMLSQRSLLNEGPVGL